MLSLVRYASMYFDQVVHPIHPLLSLRKGRQFLLPCALGVLLGSSSFLAAPANFLCWEGTWVQWISHDCGAYQTSAFQIGEIHFGRTIFLCNIYFVCYFQYFLDSVSHEHLRGYEAIHPHRYRLDRLCTKRVAQISSHVSGYVTTDKFQPRNWVFFFDPRNPWRRANRPPPLR